MTLFENIRQFVWSFLRTCPEEFWKRQEKESQFHVKFVKKQIQSVFGQKRLRCHFSWEKSIPFINKSKTTKRLQPKKVHPLDDLDPISKKQHSVPKKLVFLFSFPFFISSLRSANTHKKGILFLVINGYTLEQQIPTTTLISSFCFLFSFTFLFVFFWGRKNKN